MRWPGLGSAWNARAGMGRPAGGASPSPSPSAGPGGGQTPPPGEWIPAQQQVDGKVYGLGQPYLVGPDTPPGPGAQLVDVSAQFPTTVTAGSSFTVSV
ncbi:MAG: hypothetical protein ACQSGP_02260 [Frankia sp.]